jgi:hypothetical protein
VVVPDLAEIATHGLDALVAQLVHVPGALDPIGDQAGTLEQPEMAADRGPADRELIGDLLHRLTATAEDLDDRPAVGVAERVERVAVQIGRGQRCASPGADGIQAVCQVRRFSVTRPLP